MQPTESCPNRNAESKFDEGLRAAIASSYQLLETVEWCRERRKNPKENTAPPPNDRILEARVTDAVRRREGLMPDPRAFQRKHMPSRNTAFDILDSVCPPAPDVLHQLSAYLTDDQRAFLSDPRSDERLCDDFLDAAVAQIVGSAHGLPALELRARARALGWALVPPAQYADFYRREILPALNRLGSEVSRCPECGEAFVPRHKRQRYCSDTCSARQRNRGRQKAGNGRSAVETARRRTEDRIRRHFESCKACRAGAPCDRREAMFQADDALAHRSYEMTPELAEEVQASAGRQRKRGAQR